MRASVAIPKLQPRIPVPLIAGAVAALLVAASIPMIVRSMSPRGGSADRHIPAAQIRSLDPIDPVPFRAWPRSDAPAGGLLFVRCTNLWTAMPDGSQAHKLFSMPGLSSPAFADTARTIAFIARRAGRWEIWMAAADGSNRRPIGTVTSGGRPVDAEIRALTWSPAPDGDRLAFAMVTPGDDPFTDGSVIWVLDLATGSFERAGVGWPVPTWTGKRLAVAEPGAGGSDIVPLYGSDRPGSFRGLSEEGTAELAYGTQQAHWYRLGEYTNTVVRRQPDGDIEAAIGPRVRGGSESLLVELSGDRRLDPLARPAVAPDGLSVIFGTVDGEGQRDLATLDLVSHRWTFEDYAWDPVWSPVVPERASLDEVRARATANAFLRAWTWEPVEASVFLEGPVGSGLTRYGSHSGYVVTGAERAGDSWRVAATTFGVRGGQARYERVTVEVAGDEGRLVTRVTGTSRLHPIRTIEQASGFLRSVLTVPFVPPAGLPAGTKLSETPPDAWGDLGGHVTGSMKAEIPMAGGMRPVTFSYGQGSGFGCGSDPVAADVDGTSAVTASPRSVNQWGATPEVAWPADPHDTSGTYSVSGNLPRAQLFAIAEAMERLRRARFG